MAHAPALAHALARPRNLTADRANSTESQSKREANSSRSMMRETRRRQTACDGARHKYHSLLTSHFSGFRLLGWWNGRHVRLRGVCRKACGFKSRPEHDLHWETVSSPANCPVFEQERADSTDFGQLGRELTLSRTLQLLSKTTSACDSFLARFG